MRLSVAILGLLVGGCYCSHVAAEDAGPDALVPLDADLADAGSAPTCGVGEPAGGPLCSGASACVVEEHTLRSFDWRDQLWPAVGQRGDAVLISFRDRLIDFTQVAVVQAGGVTFRQPPFRGSGGAAFARAAGATYMLGVDVASNRPSIQRVDEAVFVEIPGMLGPGPASNAFAGDSAGCLRALLRGGGEDFEHWVVQDGRAQLRGIVDGWYATTLRVDVAGDVHIVAATRRGLRWTDGVTSEPVDAELIATGGPMWVRFGVAGTVPHVLYINPTPPGFELRHAWRGAAGWERRVLASTTASGCTGEEAPTVGATCDLERSSLVPVAVLADGAGAVRLLYGESTERATLTASCGGEDLPPDACSGWIWDSTFEGVLRVATVGDSSVHDVLLPGYGVTDGQGLATDTTMHVAIEVRGADDKELRHVALSLP